MDILGADPDLSTRGCFLRPGSRGRLGPWWGAEATPRRGLGVAPQESFYV